MTSTYSKRLTLMVQAADVARADIALTPERIYYRFATDDSIEDGELPPAKVQFDSLTTEVMEAATAREGEAELGNDVKVTLFVDNKLEKITFSEQSLRRLVEILGSISQEFNFLKGFC